MDWGDNMGGGFMNDSIVDEPQQLTSSVSVGGDDKNKLIAAVSIAQIMKFTRPNEGLILHGKKIYHLNLVALIHEVLDINPHKIHLLLDDYTSGGPLEVTHIIGDVGTPAEDPSLSMFNENAPGDSGDVKKLSDLRVGDYVRCIGVVKYNQDKANFICYNLRYVEDPNEITMHTLEVIRDSMYYERLQQGGSAMPTAVQDTNRATTTMNNPQSNYQQPSNNMANNNFGNLSTRDKILLKVLRDKGGETGMSIANMMKNLAGFNRGDIDESLATLSAEGLCWQGDSEDVWCVNATD